MERMKISEGWTSSVIEKMSKHNDGKKSGWGNELLVLSTGKGFILVKDGYEYKTKTLTELKEEFSGYNIKTETWFKFTKK